MLVILETEMISRKMGKLKEKESSYSKVICKGIFNKLIWTNWSKKSCGSCSLNQIVED